MSHLHRARCAAVGLVGMLATACAAGALPGCARRADRPAVQESRETPAPAPDRAEVSATKGQPATPSSTPSGQEVALTILYDNYPYDARLRAAWGFACLVRTGTSMVLFDTGGDGPVLLANMAILGFDPRDVDAVVLSHIHADHTGGLAALLETGARPVVYLPEAFPASYKDGIRELTAVVEVTGPMQILAGIGTSGQIGTDIAEQALAVKTPHGLLVVTGCAHPGVVELTRRSRESFGGPVAWVVGGFHLGGASIPEINAVVDGLRQLGVQRVAPTHCTGDVARGVFKDTFGPACFAAGVGWTLPSL